MQVGKWLDIMGIELRPPARPSAAKAAGVSSTSHSHGHGHSHGHALVKAKAHHAPWNEMGAGMHTPIKVGLAGQQQHLGRHLEAGQLFAPGSQQETCRLSRLSMASAGLGPIGHQK